MLSFATGTDRSLGFGVLSLRQMNGMELESHGTAPICARELLYHILAWLVLSSRDNERQVGPLVAYLKLH